MVLCTLAFTCYDLPVGNGIGTQILFKIFHAPVSLAAIRTVDEAVVIGAALSLSSSAFVLQLLSKTGQLGSKFGSATLGILLLQVNSFLNTVFSLHSKCFGYKHHHPCIELSLLRDTAAVKMQ